MSTTAASEAIQLRYKFRHSDSWVNDLVISPDSRYLFTTDGVFIKQWMLETGELVRQFEEEYSVSPVPNKALSAKCLAISPDGKRLAAGKAQSSFGLWEIEPHKFLGYGCNGSDYRWGTDNYAETRCVAFNHDGSQLLTRAGAKTDCWYMDRAREIVVRGKKTLNWPPTVAPVQYVSCIATNQDGTFLVAGDVRYLATSTWFGPPFGIDIIKDPYNEGRRHQAEKSSGVSSVAISSDSKYFATGFLDGTIKLWRAGTNLPIWHIEGHAKDPEVRGEKYTPAVGGLAFTANNETLISVADYSIRCWKVKSGQKTYDFSAEYLRRTNAVAFSPDGKTIAVADSQLFRSTDPTRGMVSIWSIDDSIRRHSSVQPTG